MTTTAVAVCQLVDMDDAWEALPAAGDEMRCLRIGEIENRAFDLFQQRMRLSGDAGSALDDWLQAERETLGIPPAELSETPSAFILRVAIPGISPENLEVAATPRELIVKSGSPAHRPAPAGEDERLCWSELRLAKGAFCRRLPMPLAIDSGNVTATLEHGILRIHAAKSPEPENQQASQGQQDS